MDNFIILEHSNDPRKASAMFKAKVIDFTNCNTIIIDGIHYDKNTLFGPIIKRNRVKCEKCGAILESVYTHHSVICGPKCGLTKIDGGKSILDRTKCFGRYTELSEFIVPKGSEMSHEAMLHSNRKL